MRTNHGIAILALLNAMMLCVSNPAIEAGEGKGETKQAEEQATSQPSSNEVENSAQWSADPERGWVRADERLDPQDQGDSVRKPNQTKGKQKGNDPKTKASDASTK